MDEAKYNELVDSVAKAVDGGMSVEEAHSILNDAKAQLAPSWKDKLLGGVQAASNIIPNAVEKIAPGLLAAGDRAKQNIETSNVNMLMGINPNQDREKVLAGERSRSQLAESAGLTNLPIAQANAPVGLLTSAIESKTTQPLGRKIFRSGLKKLDQAGSDVGKGPNAVSDTLLKYGISGNSENIKNLSNQRIGQLETEIQDLLSKPTGKIDVDRAFAPAKAQVQQVLDQPGLYTSEQVAAAQKQLDEINRLIEMNRYIPEQKIPEQVINPRTGEQTSLLAKEELAPLMGNKKQLSVDVSKPIPSAVGPEQLPLLDVSKKEQMSFLAPIQSRQTNPTQGLYTEVTPISKPSAQQTSLLTGADLESVPTQVIPEQVIPATKGMNVSEAKDLNKNLYQAIKKSSWNELMPSDVKSRLQKAMAAGNKAEYMRVANEFDPELAARLDQALQEQGALLTARKAMSKEATKEAGRHGTTQIDAMAALLEPKAYVAKQAAKAINSPWFRTGLGKYLATPSTANIYEQLGQRAIQSQQEQK